MDSAVFAVFPTAWLNGKKIQYTRSISGYSGAAHKFNRVEILDGAYDRASAIHFPVDTPHISLGAGLLLLIEENYGDNFASSTITTSILDLSASNQNNVTLFFGIRSQYLGYWWGITVTSVQVLDASDAVVLSLDIDNYTAEQTTANQRYGTLGTFPSLAVPLETSLEQPYRIIDAIHYKSIEQGYGIAAEIPDISLEQLYSMVMEIWLAQHYGDVPIISKSLIQPYSTAKIIHKSLLQEYAHALQLEVVLEQDLSMPETMEIFSEHQYGIVAEVLQATCEQLYQINANSTLFANLIQPYALAGEAARLYQFDTRLYINGERIPFHTLEWQATDTEYAWSCDFSVKDLAVAQKCVDGAAITITSAGDTWQLKCYGGWFLDKRHASEIYRVSGYSRTKDLDLALPLLGDLPGGMASALVADLAAPFGISVDWQMADGYLAAGKITANDETPREVIRRIVEDAGGIVQSTPEGNLLIVAEEEIPVPDWPTVVPADTIIAQLERISTSEQRDEQRGYNYFKVSNQLASGDGFRWDEVPIDARTKEARLFVVPFDPLRRFALTHSGGSNVSIEPFGLRSLQVPAEQVEFIAGSSKTKLPVYGNVSYTWRRTNLGTVSHAEDGLLTSATPGESLLSISYRTQYYRWIVRDPRVEDVQIIFNEVTA